MLAAALALAAGLFGASVSAAPFNATVYANGTVVAANGTILSNGTITNGTLNNATTLPAAPYANVSAPNGGAVAPAQTGLTTTYQSLTTLTETYVIGGEQTLTTTTIYPTVLVEASRYSEGEPVTSYGGVETTTITITLPAAGTYDVVGEPVTVTAPTTLTQEYPCPTQYVYPWAAAPTGPVTVTVYKTVIVGAFPSVAVWTETWAPVPTTWTTEYVAPTTVTSYVPAPTTIIINNDITIDVTIAPTFITYETTATVTSTVTSTATSTVSAITTETVTTSAAASATPLTLYADNAGTLILAEDGTLVFENNTAPTVFGLNANTGALTIFSTGETVATTNDDNSAFTTTTALARRSLNLLAKRQSGLIAGFWRLIGTILNFAINGETQVLAACPASRASRFSLRHFGRGRRLATGCFVVTLTTVPPTAETTTSSAVSSTTASGVGASSTGVTSTSAFPNNGTASSTPATGAGALPTSTGVTNINGTTINPGGPIESITSALGNGTAAPTSVPGSANNGTGILSSISSVIASVIASATSALGNGTAAPTSVPGSANNGTGILSSISSVIASATSALGNSTAAPTGTPSASNGTSPAATASPIASPFTLAADGAGVLTLVGGVLTFENTSSPSTFTINDDGALVSDGNIISTADADGSPFVAASGISRRQLAPSGLWRLLAGVLEFFLNQERQVLAACNTGGVVTLNHFSDASLVGNCFTVSLQPAPASEEASSSSSSSEVAAPTGTNSTSAATPAEATQTSLPVESSSANSTTAAPTAESTASGVTILPISTSSEASSSATSVASPSAGFLNSTIASPTGVQRRAYRYARI
ncbi:hypothetical protein SAICODRAFT_73439 [Saitoella complicata NRRL Y-17804]|uniref:uncharacterized protein n=1 Tax=Saitoella complicata (strain BCRC 22490 / CBS 7301 / JCM 7358 / NBRC 10748 / NRRL Y-17804) TaxID=698492 RepID=UPI000866CD13|nr:uncharacterized protein SAICODRAFT_73439 [Saitoella complicata NRRL Y-17804]ODQ50394.1 hypothetical protein SAICODRAFT_73439 [Saitoella complicata NRRL Y-17804]